jgi:hypothetical protein
MNARPILFSAPMVRALLEGRKTQTRRVINTSRTPKKISIDDWSIDGKRIGPCPYAMHGSLLWVRETWAQVWQRKDGQCFTNCDPGKTYVGSWYEYAATSNDPPPTWRPSIHMPRKASRLTLEITDVRAQRLQDISEVDAIDEGVLTLGDDWTRETFPHYWHSCKATPPGEKPPLGPSPRTRFVALWEQINGRDSWDANPFVWALTFKVMQSNVDAVLKAAA